MESDIRAAKAPRPLARVLVGTLLAVILIVGCGSVEPTSTPVPPTTTPLPPTPIPTATSIPPTSTPTPTAEPSPTATPDVPLGEVRFVTEDGVDLAATLFGDGEIAVILLHMGAGRATQTSWHGFARLIAGQGFAALTVDFRGRGDSEGRMSSDLLIQDARAAVQFLRDRGFERFVCMGASMGGTTCMRLALEMQLEGLVVISSLMSAGAPNEVTEQDLAQLTIPKLFIFGKWDPSAIIAAMPQMHRASAEPKELVEYDDEAHGTDLFLSPCGRDLELLLLSFLEGIRSSSPVPAPDQLVIDVPEGTAPTLDGTISPDEWTGALEARFSGGGTLLLQHDGEFLYLGIRGSTYDLAGTVFLDRGGEVAVLHASGALGTAVYEEGAGVWTRTKGFQWSCRETDASAAAQQARDEFLQREGWVASNGLMGEPEHLEYKIALSGATLRLAVGLLEAPDYNDVHVWPAWLEDACADAQLLRGPIPGSTRFSPETWMTIVPLPQAGP